MLSFALNIKLIRLPPLGSKRKQTKQGRKHTGEMMPLRAVWISALLSVLAAAQTPDGFPVKSQLPLRITLNPSRMFVTPGMLVPINETVPAPILYAPNSTTSHTTASYIAMMIDEAVPLLHWLQTDLIQASSSNKTLQPAANSSNNGIITPYVRPQPLRGQGPHGYVVLLFSQPVGWSIPSKYSSIIDPKTVTGVVSFNVTNFVSASGLSGRLVGATYFREDNTTLTSSTTISTASSTPAESGSAPPAMYTGGAEGLGVLSELVGMVGAVARLALLV